MAVRDDTSRRRDDSSSSLQQAHGGQAAAPDPQFDINTRCRAVVVRVRASVGAAKPWGRCGCGPVEGEGTQGGACWLPPAPAGCDTSRDHARRTPHGAGEPQQSAQHTRAATDSRGVALRCPRRCGRVGQATQHAHGSQEGRPVPSPTFQAQPQPRVFISKGLELCGPAGGSNKGTRVQRGGGDRGHESYSSSVGPYRR